jgi:hypothetical protein
MAQGESQDKGNGTRISQIIPDYTEKKGPEEIYFYIFGVTAQPTLVE